MISWKKTALLCAACCLLVTVFSCGEKEGGGTKLPPSVNCHQAVSGTALRGEKVNVTITNIDPETEVTVKFAKEQTITRKGPGLVSYAFEKYGSKTITVTMEPAELEKQTFKVYVEKLYDLQALAQKLRNDPQLCLVMAHRANSSDWTIPENSLPAIEKCIADKIDIVENDLYTTKDGVLVVSHDPSLNRETNGSGNIADKTLDQIKALFLKDRNGTVTDQKMLTFDEYLEACKGRIYINVDLGDRNASIPDVVAAIAKKGMTGQVLVYCNSKDKIISAFKTNQECNVYSWVSHAQEIIDNGLPGNLYFTQCEWKASDPKAARNGKAGTPTSATTVASAVNAGTILTVNAIYTTNTEQLYPKSFPDVQAEDIFKVFPATQCIHVDTGAEARAALQSIGRRVMQYD